jgi:WD repeat-containing protein 55
MVFLLSWFVSVILSGSADCSVLASDVETGKAIACLEDAHE